MTGRPWGPMSCPRWCPKLPASPTPSIGIQLFINGYKKRFPAISESALPPTIMLVRSFWTLSRKVMDTALYAIIYKTFSQQCFSPGYSVFLGSETPLTNDADPEPGAGSRTWGGMWSDRVRQRRLFASRCRRGGDFLPAAGGPTVLKDGTATRRRIRRSDIARGSVAKFTLVFGIGYRESSGFGM